MSKDDCKQRFKGVENFLRRVAFNLGNTPSQTEVKVISCIPIDVSDLQQKIVELEKQLEAVNGKGICTSQIRINTALCNTSFPKITNVANSSKAISCHHSSASLPCPNLSIKNSKTSIILPPGPCAAPDYFVSTDASEMTYSKNHKQEGKKKFFSKKMGPKKKKMRTQLVYYAQTVNRSPFNQHGLPDDGTFKNRGNEENNAFERSYLSDMVRKQYNPGAVNVDFNMSEFSTPVCRDFIRAQKLLDLQSHESDMCSCCHGPFKNIDDHMSKHNHCDIFSSQTESKNTYSYYDSKFYDLIPVKENSVKIKNTEHLKRKEPKQLNKNHTDITCWPGYIRPRCRDMPPIIVNYNTTGPTRQHITKMPVKSHNRKALNKMYKKPVTSAPISRQVKTNVSKIRSVEVSEVYTRRLDKNRRKIVSKPAPIRITKQSNDVACLTTIIANTECQTASGPHPIAQENKNAEVRNVTAPEDKTKVTLNQIKEILQSVLTEVKTNSKIGNIPGQAKKKDAVVQNGLSKSNIFGGSSLLQTFTYSPYDIDPYGPSCSQQMQTSNLCYPNMPSGSAKCMQHYPLFVQPGRNMCASCYNPNRNNPTVNKLPNMKRAASTATNTEELRTRSKETENLIREIYKAMALNVDIATEDTPIKDHGDINKTIQNNYTKSDKESNHLANAISEIFKNTNPIETSVTQNTGTPLDSKLSSNQTISRSHPRKSYARNENEKYYNNDARFDNSETEQVSRQLESDEESDSTAVNEETESSASETESEYDGGDVVLAIEEPVKKKEKQGLFSKMLRIFTPRSRNSKRSKVINQSTVSDSVDYRIIHGNKPIAPKSALKPITSRSRAVVYYSKKPQKYRNQSPELPRKPPYMEQEHRRYFDEKLMFHDAQDPKSSTRGMPPRRKPVYYQKIETRSALVDHCHQRENRQNYPETISVKQYLNSGNKKLEEKSYTKNTSERASIVPAKALRWLGKHKLGIHCGKQWKKLIIES